MAHSGFVLSSVFTDVSCMVCIRASDASTCLSSSSFSCSTLAISIIRDATVACGCGVCCCKCWIKLAVGAAAAGIGIFTSLTSVAFMMTASRSRVVRKFTSALTGGFSPWVMACPSCCSVNKPLRCNACLIASGVFNWLACGMVSLIF